MAYTLGISTESSVHRAIQFLKRIAYRSRFLNAFSRPRYSYNIEPAQLAWLVQMISETEGGSIVEIGVARGMTTCFLLEHMRCTGDHRPYYCIDTFSGFTESDIEYELTQRQKPAGAFGAFSYGDRDVFELNLSKNQYDNATVIKADASQFDYSVCKPIDVVLLDIDLYAPTKAVLSAIAPHMNERSFIMVDDCRSGLYDGSDQAYSEYITETGRARIMVGTKAGVIEF